MAMPYVWRGIDGQYLSFDSAQLDWDTAWADAVHTHQSDAEGGTLDAAAITGSVTGSGNIVKATAPTVTTLTVSSGGLVVSSGTSALQAVTATTLTLSGQLIFTDAPFEIVHEGCFQAFPCLPDRWLPIAYLGRL